MFRLKHPFVCFLFVLNSILFQAIIIAIDKTPQKAAKIQVNCDIQGVTCVTPYSYDSTKICSEMCSDVNKGPPFPPNCFDKVLLDAPCSGLGQRPQLVNKMTPNMMESYKFVQRKLLCAVSSFLFWVQLQGQYHNRLV